MDRDHRLATWIALGITLAVALILLAALCLPAEAAGIPRAMQAHKGLLVRSCHAVWGLDAPVAVMAGQVHQESKGDASAVSPVGAGGVAQFMPATASWLAEAHPELGRPDVWSPAWSLRALATYDLWICERVKGAASDCDRWAMILSAYNGGLGWVIKDRALAARQGLDSATWWDQVETVNAGRKPAAWTENRAYPRLILLEHQPLYLAWGPGVSCEVRR